MRATYRTEMPSHLEHLEQFFAPCPRGLEPVLAEELEDLSARDVVVSQGGVAFRGHFVLVYRANLESRIASRILWQVGHFKYRTESDVYNRVKAIDWSSYFPVDCTIRVNVAATDSPLKSLDFITLRIKDAVCDRFRDDISRRPSVETKAPDIRIHAFFDAEWVSVYLDTSGEPLFKRGLRTLAVEAPVRENLAAGILHLTGWKPGQALLDPMCGGGTFLLEAAEIALDRAPGARRQFAFERLSRFDAETWRSLREAALARERTEVPAPIYGSDLYGDVVKVARENVRRAGLDHAVSLKQVNALEVSPPASEGILVTNPPYGVRLGEASDLEMFYPKLGDALKRRFAGWRAFIFTGDMRLPKLIGLKPRRRTPLYNGALECRLYEFELIAGSMRKPKPATGDASS